MFPPAVAVSMVERGGMRTDAWKKILGDPVDENLVERLRGGISRGRPLGSDRFIAKLEAKLNRRLRPVPRGRPRKAEKR